MSNLIFYCHDVHDRASIMDYFKRIGVSIVAERVDNQIFLRLECPAGSKMELADTATIEPRYCISCPNGAFFVIFLRRPPLSNQQLQYLLTMAKEDYDRVMGVENADT